MAAQLGGVARRCAELGGEPASAEAVDHWLTHRNRVPSFGEFLEKGIVLDTIEVAATWDRVMPLYRTAVASLQGVEGLLNASAHTSHSYRSGSNLYLTFLARPAQHEQMEATYSECWRRVLDATVGAGGGIAHHHGIGRVRAARLVDEIGPTGVDLLRAIKGALDPEDLLNPGALLPPKAR